MVASSVFRSGCVLLRTHAKLTTDPGGAARNALRHFPHDSIGRGIVSAIFARRYGSQAPSGATGQFSKWCEPLVVVDIPLQFAFDRKIFR
jgi:hypothetical protein